MSSMNYKITKDNYAKVAKELKLSYSILKRLAEIRPFIFLNDDVCFYDIETEGSNFKLGVVNDKVFYNPEEMLNYIKAFKVCCGFNNFRFDNEILFKSNPEFFKTINYGNFALHKVANCINIDLLPVFMLYKPFKASHKLDELAKELNLQRNYVIYGENKCKEDIKIMQAFYPIAKQLLNWIEKNFFIDPETLCTLYYRDFAKLRRWMLQSWMLQHGIYPKLIKVKDKRKPSFYKFYRKGFFRNIYVYDVSSAYPTTAIKLNCSLYKKGDFAEYEKFLLEERAKNPDIQEFIKWVSNATIGDMNFTDGLLYNKKILVDVWLAFKKVMQNWVKKVGKKNIVYAYTDCLFTTKQINVFPEGYNVKLKHKFDWVAIFNQIRYIGLSNGQIHKVHFDRKINIKLFDYLDAMIEEKLRRNPLKFLKNPKLDIKLEELPRDAFQIVVFKKNDVCKNAEYLEIWDDLNYGLNNVYLSRNGLTTDASFICYNRYNKYVNYYLKLFKL